LLQKIDFMMKNDFFQDLSSGIGPVWHKLAEIGQKLDFRAFYSEI
jgi:hypothetical protein